MLLNRHRRRGVDGFRNDESTDVKSTLTFARVNSPNLRVSRARMRTARPVPAASQPLRNARRRGERSTRGFHRSLTPDDLRRDASYLRSRIWRVHAHGCKHVLDDLLGESGCRGREVKMPSGRISAGEVSPRLQGTGMSDIVGAGKCGDRTSNAILRIDRIPRNEREILRPAARSYEFRSLHDCCRRAAKPAQNCKRIAVRRRACLGAIGGSEFGTPAAGTNRSTALRPSTERSCRAASKAMQTPTLWSKKPNGTSMSGWSTCSSFWT